MDKVVCVGKNYLAHAKELSVLIGDSIPEKPVLFLKPPSSIFKLNKNINNQINLPFERGEIHHECEVVLKIKKQCYKLTLANVKEVIEGFSLGLDMTIRDLQSQLKKNGHPWETAKAFKNSTIVGEFVAYDQFEKYSSQKFEFIHDGLARQQAQVSEMSLSIEECVCYASEFFELFPGDLIFTGTPAGVGPITKGSKSVLRWDDINYELTWVGD